IGMVLATTISYHCTAAKFDELLADKAEKYKHEALAEGYEIKEKVNEVLQNMEQKPKGMFEKLKEWTGVAEEPSVTDKVKDAGKNVKEYAQDAFETAKNSAISSKDYVKDSAMKASDQ